MFVREFEVAPVGSVRQAAPSRPFGLVRRTAAGGALLVAASLGLTMGTLGTAQALAPATDPNCAPSTTDPSRVVCTYTTAGEHMFTVPAGVTSLEVDAVGAAGGKGITWGGSWRPRRVGDRHRGGAVGHQQSPGQGR